MGNLYSLGLHCTACQPVVWVSIQQSTHRATRLDIQYYSVTGHVPTWLLICSVTQPVPRLFGVAV